MPGEDGSPAGLEPLAAYVMRALFRALEYLHGRGWMHRDIKSDNLLLGPGGEVKLGDLGFAVHLDKERPNRCARASLRMLHKSVSTLQFR